LPALFAFPNFQHAALEQRVDHLQQEEGVAGGPRYQFGAHLLDAVAHAESGLQQADLLFGRQALQVDAHQTLDVRQDAVLGAGRQQHQHG
jgi:hypothetical protein